MKTPQEYIQQVLPAQGHGSQTICFVADAERAIAQAQDDLHAYYRQLLRAIRHSRP